MPSVAVNPKLLRWAIERSGKSASDLSRAFPKINEWLSGEHDPTFRQLQDFARRTMTPFGTLLLDQPPADEISIPDFRTVGDTPIKRPSPNLIDTIDETRRRQAFMREYRLDAGWTALPYIASATPSMAVTSLAQEMRKQLQLIPDWAEALATWEEALGTLRAKAEIIGVILFSNSVVGLNNHRSLDPEEFRGFVLCDAIVPTIFLNDSDSKSARIFTLVHELVHLWLGLDAIVNLVAMMPARDKTERFCNQVAAEFLVPKYKLMSRWDDVRHRNDRFKIVSRWFKVSPVVVARRALDLKLIDTSEFFDFYHADKAAYLKQKKKERQKKGGGNFYATQAVRLGRPFSAALVSATREGAISYREAHRLSGMKGETFTTFADKVLERTKNERQ